MNRRIPVEACFRKIEEWLGNTNSADKCCPSKCLSFFTPQIPLFASAMIPMHSLCCLFHSQYLFTYGRSVQTAWGCSCFPAAPNRSFLRFQGPDPECPRNPAGGFPDCAQSVALPWESPHHPALSQLRMCVCKWGYLCGGPPLADMLPKSGHSRGSCLDVCRPQASRSAVPGHICLF